MFSTAPVAFSRPLSHGLACVTNPYQIISLIMDSRLMFLIVMNLLRYVARTDSAFPYKAKHSLRFSERKSKQGANCYERVTIGPSAPVRTQLLLSLLRRGRLAG